MKTITLYKDDFSGNALHPNMWENTLEDLGIETHTVVAGRSINNEYNEVTLTVVGAVPSSN
jgi:hypothetical protein